MVKYAQEDSGTIASIVDTDLDNIIDNSTKASEDKTTKKVSTAAPSNSIEETKSQSDYDDSVDYGSDIKLIVSPSTVYLGGSNPTDTSITVRAADGSIFGYVGIDKYYDDIIVRADSLYGPGDEPITKHYIDVTQIDPNSSGEYIVGIHAYGDNGLYKGSFRVVYSKARYYLAEMVSVTRTEDASTITYSYNINITDASLPKNSTVIVSIPPDYGGNRCTNKNSLTKTHVYIGPSSYGVDCVVTKYIPPPPCTQVPCDVPPLRSEGNIRIGISVMDSAGQYIRNTGYSNFNLVVPEDYDI
jgi:hypothetical protein